MRTKYTQLVTQARTEEQHRLFEMSNFEKSGDLEVCFSVRVHLRQGDLQSTQIEKATDSVFTDPLNLFFFRDQSLGPG